MVISDENMEGRQLGVNRDEAGFRNGSARLFNGLKDIGNDYLFAKYGIKHFLG